MIVMLPPRTTCSFLRHVALAELRDLAGGRLEDRGWHGRDSPGRYLPIGSAVNDQREKAERRAARRTLEVLHGYRRAAGLVGGRAVLARAAGRRLSYGLRDDRGAALWT